MTQIQAPLEVLDWQKGVDRQLKDTGGNLVVPSIYPASPYGGASPPSASWYTPVTSAVFGVQAAQPWAFNFDRITHRGLAVDVEWATDAGTTGELRLSTSFLSKATNVVVLGAASSGVAQFKWLHEIPLWVTQFIGINVEARRTGGAGNVNIRYPRTGGLQCGPQGCTLTGL